MRAQSTVKFLYTGSSKISIGLGARAQSTAPYANTYSRIGGYSCVAVTYSSSAYFYIFDGSGSSAALEKNSLTEDSWYTLEFTAEGTDFTCTLYDEDGTTVASETKSDDTYTSGYNGLVPYTLSADTTAWYVSEYTITVL